jgi:hypothetical protein
VRQGLRDVAAGEEDARADDRADGQQRRAAQPQAAAQLGLLG